VTLNHVGPLKKVDIILSLDKWWPSEDLSDGNAKKVVESPKVRHGELRDETGDDAPREIRRGCCEDDVVDIQ
jgi:hypothetical protein